MAQLRHKGEISAGGDVGLIPADPADFLQAGLIPSRSASFARRLRMYSQRVHASGEFRRQRRIYHAVALDPALPFERVRHNIDPEMRLAAGSVARMAFMKM